MLDLLIKNGTVIDGTGAKRMVMRSQGVEYTLVNGEVTWERGQLTGATAGHVLRS